MSDTNRVGLRIAKTNARTVPVDPAPSNLTALRLTGTPSLGFTPNTIVSNELRPDRQVSDLIPVGAEASGDVGFELSYGTFDDVIEASLFSTWVNAPRRTGTSEITAFAAGQITVDDGTVFAVGMIVRLDFLAAGDAGRGVYVIDAISTNDLTVVPYDSNTNAVAAGFSADSDTVLIACGIKATANGEIDLDVTGTVGTLTASGSTSFAALMGAATPLAAGQWIKIAGSSAANNVWARVVTADATTITFTAPTGAVTDAAASARLEVFYGDYVRNGSGAVSDQQFLIERRFEDHSPVNREVLLGMTPGVLNISLQPQAIATGTITFTGFTAAVSSTPGDLYASTPTDIDAPQFDVYNTSSNVGRIGSGADVVATTKNFVLDASININNNLRPLNAVGVFGAANIGAGEFSVTGSLSTYFDDASRLQQILDGTETSFDVSVKSNDGRSLLFDLPRLKFTSGIPEVPGKNADVVINPGYQALLDETLGYTLHVQRFAFVA